MITLANYRGELIAISADFLELCFVLREMSVLTCIRLALATAFAEDMGLSIAFTLGAAYRTHRRRRVRAFK